MSTKISNSPLICSICNKQHNREYETCASCTTKEQQMNIEIGKKYINKYGKVVEVESIKDNHFDDNHISRAGCVWFWDKQGGLHVLTESDFLQQYEPYEVVYEYRYCFLNESSYDISSRYFTDKEVKPSYWIAHQRLDFTKRERK